MRWPVALPILALIAVPAVAAAQDLAQAKAFVAGLYAAYAKPPGPDYLGRQAKEVFSPALLTLIRREAAHTPQGEVGALDGDPICNCQDYKITGVGVTVTAAGPGKARAVARFRNLGRSEVVRFDLVASQGQWRVDDVHAAGIPSLAKLLKASLSAAPR